MDRQKIEHAIRSLLEAIGEDPEREGLRGTPDRVARFWEEFVEYDPGNLDVNFESVQVDQLVILKGVPFVSLCEHHLLPFKGTVTLGYLTGKRVLGLSKLARIVQKAAHNLQIQERMTKEIADEIQKLVPDAFGVAVLVRAHHSCMSMRGIKSKGDMVTSVLYGGMRDNPTLRHEFLTLANG